MLDFGRYRILNKIYSLLSFTNTVKINDFVETKYYKYLIVLIYLKKIFF